MSVAEYYRMSNESLSVATDLTVVGRAYRQARYTAGNRVDAERAALDAYRSLHPDAPEIKARDMVARIIKASSEAGLIWIED
jgi:hypothetical protein